MAKQEKSLRDGNGRSARLARWLEQQPTSLAVDLLVLELRGVDNEWAKLQAWPRSMVNQALAFSIDSTIQDAANEQGQYITARCAWVDSKSGTYWTEHQLRVHPEDMEGQQAFDGTAQSQAILLQRHQERVLSMGHGYTNTAMASMREAMQLSKEAATQAQSENIRLREKVSELEGENARLSAMLEQALSAAEDAEKRVGQSDDDEKKQVMGLIQTALAAPRLVKAPG